MGMLVSPVCRDLALVTCTACREPSGEAGVRGEGFHPCDRWLLYKKEVACLTQERKALILLPYVMDQLLDDDSDASAAALPVLGNMLWLLEGKRLSLTALALAGKLLLLFNNVRLGESPMSPFLGTSIHASHCSPCALQGDALPCSPQTPLLPLVAPCCVTNPPPRTHSGSASLPQRGTVVAGWQQAC